MPKVYLGDAVYADFDGFHIWLTTENGIRVTNSIALEPSVYRALVEYQQRIGRAQAADPRTETT